MLGRSLVPAGALAGASALMLNRSQEPAAVVPEVAAPKAFDFKPMAFADAGGDVPHDAAFYMKCRMQTNPEYTGVFQGFKLATSKGGISEVTVGWLPTLIGYSIQGLFKFGFYEIFKDVYADAVGYETAVKYRTLVYAAASASAEFIADIGLCPWESVKVRAQTSPPEAQFPRSMSQGMSRIYKAEGINGFYKGLSPLWARQIPYTITKFVFFERVVEAFYKYVFTAGKESYSKSTQLSVTFASGYIAGVGCALVSQAPDSIVSKLNQSDTATIGGIIKENGLFKLATAGLLPRVIMIGTLTGLQWWIYDAFKTAAGLGVSGGIQKK
jgi:solute carrier family 25 phosphate transporter 3